MSFGCLCFDLVRPLLSSFCMSRYLDGEESSLLINDFNLVFRVRDDAGDENSAPNEASAKGPIDRLRLYSAALCLRYSSLSGLAFD